MPAPKRLRLPPLATELSRFGLVGLASNGVYFGCLWLLTGWGSVALWLGGAISYAASMLLNYTLQRGVTFRSATAHTTAGPRYLVAQVVALSINSAVLHLLVTLGGFHFVVGQGVALVATTAWNYLCQKHWVFRSNG